MRLDKALWFLRLAPSRSAAQALAAAGHIRLDGRRVERASALVRVGSVLVLPAVGAQSGPRIIRILSLPVRRGPFVEASRCYASISPETAQENGAD
jgi:ribosome-associated heat shock protein Hsp15